MFMTLCPPKWVGQPSSARAGMYTGGAEVTRHWKQHVEHQVTCAPLCIYACVSVSNRPSVRKVVFLGNRRWPEDVNTHAIVSDS